MTLIALSDYITTHWAAFAITLTVLSLIVFVVLLLAKYVRISLNIFVDTPLPLAIGAEDFERLIGEEMRFRSFDGTSLRGMYIRTSNPMGWRGTIVFCHEYGSDMYSCARYVRPLIGAGFDVFTFDFRGHGESSNRGRYRPLQWVSDKELEDVLGAVGHVETILAADGRPSKIGLFGISRGAGAGLLAASSSPSVKAIVCDGAFCTDTTLMALMKRWARIFARVKLVYDNHSELFWRLLVWMLIHFAQPRMGCKYLSVSKALRHMVARPIFFVHGGKDSYVHVEQTHYLYSQAPMPKYMWVVPGAKHNQSVMAAPKEYASRTVAFFCKHLADENVAESEIISPADVEVA